MAWDSELAVIGAAVCAVTAVVSPAVVRLTPEPAPDPKGDQAFEMTEPKETYAAISARVWFRPVVMLLAAATGGLLWGRLGESWLLVPATGLAIFGAMLAVIDVRTKYLPTALIVPLYLLAGAAAIGSAVADSRGTPLLLAGLGWVLFGGFFTVLWLFVPAGGLGFGDVRLAGALGLMLGLAGLGAVMLGLLATALSGGVVALVGMATGVRRFPYGPNLLIGGIAGLAFAGPFVSWYLG